MAHPFFESDVYPWERKEATPLYELLVALIPDPNQIVLVFEQSGGLRSALNTAQAPGLIWGDALRLLAAGRLLERFCTRLKAIGGLQQNADFQAAIDAVVEAEADVERSIVADNVLVLDRIELRETLRQLTPDDSPLRVVLVRGAEKTGKTWARYVFQGAARDRGADVLYLDAGTVATVDEVVDYLFITVEAPASKPDPGATTPQAWYRAVCRELMKAAMARRRPLWIAIDDLGHIDEEIREFCDQVGRSMKNPAFAQWFRLMLIHYPARPVPTDWAAEVWTEDVTTEADVQLDDVEAFLSDWAARAGLGMLEADIRQLAKEVVERAEAPVPDGEPVLPRLQRLHDHLVETLRTQKP
jgi:hypothetical protein